MTPVSPGAPRSNRTWKLCLPHGKTWRSSSGLLYRSSPQRFKHPVAGSIRAEVYTTHPALSKELPAPENGAVKRRHTTSLSSQTLFIISRHISLACCSGRLNSLSQMWMCLSLINQACIHRLHSEDCVADFFSLLKGRRSRCNSGTARLSRGSSFPSSK